MQQTALAIFLATLTASQTTTFPFRDDMSGYASSEYWLDYGPVGLTSSNCPTTTTPLCVEIRPSGELYFLHFPLTNVSDISIEFSLNFDLGDDATSTSTTSTTLAPRSPNQQPATTPTLSLYLSCDMTRWNMAQWSLLSAFPTTASGAFPNERLTLPAQCDRARDFNLAFISHFTVGTATLSSFAILPRTDSPTTSPTKAPSRVPTTRPTLSPTVVPTPSPTGEPTTAPTESTASPTMVTMAPTVATPVPTGNPSAAPTRVPSVSPTMAPTAEPSEAPTESTYAPTVATMSPTKVTQSPTESTHAPTMPTGAPTRVTESPTRATLAPTVDPTASPSAAPTIDLVKYLVRFNPTATTTPSPVVAMDESGEVGASAERMTQMPTVRPMVADEGSDGSDGYREGSASPTSAPTNGSGRFGVAFVGAVIALQLVAW